MKTSIMRKLVAASLMSMMVPCVAFAVPIYVDHFTAPPGGQAITQVPVGTTATFAPGLGTSALLGARYLAVTKIGGSSGGSHAVDINNTAFPSVMADNMEAGVDGNTLLIWDGNGNSTVEYTAGPVDLTAGGINNYIQLHILSNDLPGTVTLNFGDGTTNANYLFTLPGFPSPFPTDVIIPFSAWSGVNFTQIRGGSMAINMLANEDLRIDFIAADGSVPEPSTFLLLGAGLGGLALLRRRK
jgi:hypothetical protein